MKFTYDWTSQNIPLFKETLTHLKGQPNLRALEIGSFEGRSAVWFLENILTHHTSRLTCIDTFEGSAEHAGLPCVANMRATFDENTRGYAGKIAVAVGKSHDILPQLERESFDFIYVDGSHDSQDVLKDAMLSWPLLKPGGIMIFDDYGWKNPAVPQNTWPERGIDDFILYTKLAGDRAGKEVCTIIKIAYALALKKL